MPQRGRSEDAGHGDSHRRSGVVAQALQHEVDCFERRGREKVDEQEIADAKASYPDGTAIRLRARVGSYFGRYSKVDRGGTIRSPATDVDRGADG